MGARLSKYPSRLTPEELDWLRLSPAQRMIESAKLWKFYLAMGGTLDSQPDPQGPFNFPKTILKSCPVCAKKKKPRKGQKI